MMRLFGTLILCVLFNVSSYSTELEVYFDHKNFIIPGDIGYVETHLEFVGTSLLYKPLESGFFQANVEVTMILKKGEEIIDFKKLSLEGPEINLENKVNFIDVQRFIIDKEASYTFELEFTDLNDPDMSSLSHEETFMYDLSDTQAGISDIIFLKGYSKAEESTDLSHSGYNLLPLVSDYFPTDLNSVIFYSEIYNTDKEFGEGEMYLLTYELRSRINNEVVGNSKVMKRQNTEKVTPILTSFDLTDVPAGHYNLIIEIRNKKNEVVAERTLGLFRQKLDKEKTYEEISEMAADSIFTLKYLDKNILRDHINSCLPIASNMEKLTIQNQIPSSDLSTMQKYLYYFWEKRNEQSPEAAWNEYKQRVDYVNEEFSTRIKRGYETERGRVYLQYGKPNTMVVKHNNMTIYPYEVWHYYEISNLRDRRFLFYNTDQVSNDFELLHSDMVGEVKNNNWFEVMAQRSTAYDIATESVDRNYDNSGNAELEILRDLYFNPR